MIEPLALAELLDAFPWHLYPQMLPNQRLALETIARQSGSMTLELPTGSGKTAVGYTFLKVLADRGAGPLFYVVPNKTLVDQVKQFHPELTVVYGRNEYPCLYYSDQKLQADDIPCSLLVDCIHRVDQETGLTKEHGATPCPYLLAKFQAKKSKMVVCTMAFYLFTQLYSKEWDKPAGLVVDEAHQLAKVIRGCLSFEITDYHLRRSIALLRQINSEEAEKLAKFLSYLTKTVIGKPARRQNLLEDNEIRDLMSILLQVNGNDLRRQVSQAIASGDIDTTEHREVLTKVERVLFDLGRYLRSFEYSLASGERGPLNYTYAYYTDEPGEKDKVRYRLVIKAYYVVPVIKRILSPRTLAYSATIGNPEIFGFESGIQAPFVSFGSDFAGINTRVFMPKDTANLAQNSRNRREPNRSLRQIVRACRQFQDQDIRCLVVVMSEKERQKFLGFCREEKLNAVSYGDGVLPKETAHLFKEGQGSVLVGTAANYGEGIDLPRNIAPVIFFLRPGYPSPEDPATKFEERRFGRQRWAVWNWRVMIEALQVRGRNVRSSTDVGVTFFISQQFRRFLFASLPKWLQESYRGDLTLQEGIEEAKEILTK